jgi:GMP synthase-like glutamine amidotransferase
MSRIWLENYDEWAKELSNNTEVVGGVCYSVRSEATYFVGHCEKHRAYSGSASFTTSL